MNSFSGKIFLAILIVASQSVFAGTLAQFRTVFGDIEVELYDSEKPVTVQNFKRYVESGRYQDSFAHRLVPGFVIQGGGFTVTNRGTTNWAIAAVPTFPPITNEFGIGPRYSNVFGTIAMAKVAGDTNSASSQWFINLGQNTNLDANDTNNLFVVFGHVISGTNVLNIFKNFQYLTNIDQTNIVLHQQFFPPFDDLPLLRPVVVETNFLFFDISLLNVQVAPAPNGMAISWNSASNLVNNVEFTTNFPPVWHLLGSTNGNGNRMTLLDATTNRQRFYRVRVDY